MCELEQWHTLPLAGAGKAGERRYAALREAVELLEAKASVPPTGKEAVLRPCLCVSVRYCVIVCVCVCVCVPLCDCVCVCLCDIV